MAKSKKPKRKPTGKAPSFKKQVDAKAAQAGLTQLPTMALVATIDTMIGILRDRGHKQRGHRRHDRLCFRLLA